MAICPLMLMKEKNHWGDTFSSQPNRKQDSAVLTMETWIQAGHIPGEPASIAGQRLDSVIQPS